MKTYFRYVNGVNLNMDKIQVKALLAHFSSSHKYPTVETMLSTSVAGMFSDTTLSILSQSCRSTFHSLIYGCRFKAGLTFLMCLVFVRLVLKTRICKPPPPPEGGTVETL